MPSSYLSRHRPICAVLQEIKLLAMDERIDALCDEAIGYAQAMSTKLSEYKLASDKLHTTLPAGLEAATTQTSPTSPTVRPKPGD